MPPVFDPVKPTANAPRPGIQSVGQLRGLTAAVPARAPVVYRLADGTPLRLVETHRNGCLTITLEPAAGGAAVAHG